MLCIDGSLGVSPSTSISPHNVPTTPSDVYPSEASTSQLPSHCIHQASSNDIPTLLKPDAHGGGQMQDGSRWAVPSTSTSFEAQQSPARRQTLADRFRSARRRSSQRLSWPFAGGYRSTESPAIPAESQNTDKAEELENSSDVHPASVPTHTGTGAQTPETDMEVDVPAGDSADRDPFRIMTPPPEEDLMFEERQRARRLVEEALAQLQSELARSRSPLSSSTPNVSQRVGERSVPETPSDLPMQGQTTLNDTPLRHVASLPESQVMGSDMHVEGVEQTAAGDPIPAVSIPTRMFAPLPRRSASRSPTPPADNSRFPVLRSPSPLGVMSAPATSATAPTASTTMPPPPLSGNPVGGAPDDLMVPRRILVQGIVSSSPPPPSALPSRPSSNLPTSSNNVSSGLDQASSRDNGLWDELPGMEAVDHLDAHSDADSASADDDQVWDNAVAAVLSQRPQDRSTVAQPTSEDPQRALRQQAHLIGRLLCVAAAATAATLIPGITVDGSPVTGFGESQGTDLLGGTGIPLGRTHSRPASPAMAPIRQRSDSLGTFRTRRASLPSQSPSANAANSTPEAVSSSSATLQGILRNALSAAFRSASPSGTSGPENATTSEATDAPTASRPDIGDAAADVTQASTSGPLEGALHESPHHGTAFASQEAPLSRATSELGRGASLAIPVASLQYSVPLLSGQSHANGTFERFLADLQAE